MRQPGKGPGPTQENSYADAKISRNPPYPDGGKVRVGGALFCFAKQTMRESTCSQHRPKQGKP